MLDRYLSRFSDHQPVLVAPESARQFESCLRSFAAWGEKAEEHLLAVSANDGFWAHEDSWLAKYQPYVVRDGVLQIPVKGALISDFNYSLGYMTGYDYIWRAFQRGMDDGSVKGIALVVDSPGGTVTGCFECVDKMFALKSEKTKPVKVFVSDGACSAAYAIASVGDEINMSRTARVGSVGVVTMHVDISKMMADAGYKITFIYAGKHKVDGNAYEPLPDSAKERIQARIDETYDVFVSTVARNRPALSDKAVRKSEALVFGASEATSNGFADKVGAIDDSLAEFTASLNLNEGDSEMADYTQAQLDEAVAAATASAHAAGVAEGTKAGATAEKARIVAILNSEVGKARPNAALAAALDTDLSAEQADAFLAKLSVESAPVATEKPNAFVAAMDSAEHPNIDAGTTADASGPDPDGKDIAALAKSFGLPNFKAA
jgi:signal peptide peptidase SppA